ncbi:DUF2889 domain-containing protein [Burkholderia multivorans]|uniref:DUF2889 domain-containing protein n=1 Tax=Burkholderia multivorans TaxID=87883 RepID=UPI000D38A1F5|nr:DUF2889 domain-containing protein [Burkholderia multivorans]MBR7896407.1 DUF2889 domain-containing protein [Burkholderia multivorans]MBR8021380.1 DUF2889 domain-containing protein [Burkholderia multivorans]MEB2511895.1 DUF2889 domain-containing protein [Burkholderia multivorans]MEB2521493.1 DUF2889 domain-containing protein [Burkholderia multivorans]MEB2575368.1 DUF2889 domain-containing protein [Burkholderia multivorans]
MTVHDHAAATERITREPLHTRQITFEGFRRSDGLFEIEGYLTDRKPHDFAPPSSPRVVPANEPIHDLGLRVVFDLDMVVHEVETFIRAYPYRECPGGGATLQALVGLRIGAGWSGEVRKRLPPGDTCTHLREILIPLATAAIQTVNPLRSQTLLDATDASGKPLKIDSCFAYGASRELVLQRWPAFHRPDRS